MNLQKVFRLNTLFARLAKFYLLVKRHLGALRDEMRFSKETISQRRSVLDHFLRYIQDVRKLDIEPQHVTKAMVIEYLKWLTDVEGLAINTVSGHATSLRTFYRWLTAENILRDNPLETLRPPKRIKTLPRPMTPSEIEALINAINPKDRRELRDLAVIELLYGSGLRLNEALSTKRQDLILGRRRGRQPHVRVLGKGKKFRVVPLTTEFVSVFFRHMEVMGRLSEQDYVFVGRAETGKHLPKSAFELRFKRYLKRAGLDLKITPHCLRHSFATHMLANGADIYTISVLMGHEQLSTTMVYSAVSQTQVFDAFRAASPRDRFKIAYEDRVQEMISSL